MGLLSKEKRPKKIFIFPSSSEIRNPLKMYDTVVLHYSSFSFTYNITGTQFDLNFELSTWPPNC